MNILEAAEYGNLEETEEKRYKIVESPDGKTLGELSEIGYISMNRKWGILSKDGAKKYNSEFLEALLGGEGK